MEACQLYQRLGDLYLCTVHLFVESSESKSSVNHDFSAFRDGFENSLTKPIPSVNI
jgi:hypothetical protein